MLYDDRNHILRDIFTSTYYKKDAQIIKNSKDMFIDCKTGVGTFFGRLCNDMAESIASGIQLKICTKCYVTNGIILPFLSINMENIEYIQNSIATDRSHERLCNVCKREYKVKKIYNNVLTVEIEPIEGEAQEKIAIQNLSGIKLQGRSCELVGVIQYDATINHFVAHVKRKTKVWKTYDDMKASEFDTDVTVEIMPFMLFFRCGNYYTNDYHQTL